MPRGHISFVDDDSSGTDEAADISNEPSIRFSRKIWYESLLSLYAEIDPRYTKSLTRTDRETIAQNISMDLRFLFRVSNYWFSFFHIPTFFSNFNAPAKRDLVQPSLIMAALALGILWQSSEIEMGQRGRERALKIREEVHESLHLISIKLIATFLGAERSGSKSQCRVGG